MKQVTDRPSAATGLIIVAFLVLVNEAEDLTTSLMYVAMSLGITLKLVMAVIGHTFFVYAAAKIVGAWNVYTFLFAAFFHYMANVLIGP